MAISRIASITVPVADHDRALLLYRDVLGFQIMRDVTRSERGREVHMTAPRGGAAIILIAANADRPLAPTHGGALQVNDMLDAVERLAGGGFEVTVTVDHLDSPAGVWAQFQDLDQNAWLLWQPADRVEVSVLAA